jgi:hypothetical protein
VSISGASNLSFELRVQRDPRMVSIVRRFVERSLERLVGDADSAFRISMTAHELLENAAKYGVSEHTGLRVDYQAGDARALVRLTNETTPVHVARLRERIRVLQNAPSPAGLYRSLMRDSFAAGEESGLGLARICAEGELRLALEIEGNMVTIMASSHPAGGNQVG